MIQNQISRRKAIGNTFALSVAAMTGFGFNTIDRPFSKRIVSGPKLPFRISMNTSTILAYELPADQQIKMVSAAGFDGIELWMRDIRAYVDKGGSAAHLKEMLEEGQLTLENMIAFSKWCSDVPEERKKAIDDLRNEMLLIAELGGKHIAAPVQGIEAIDRAKLDEYAERYEAILQLEAETGVLPVIELWGMGALNKVADCAHIVIASGHPKATMLLDIYHIYRGGNDWDTLDCLNGARLPVIHMNDYPATPTYDLLKDSDRVLPGEGVCSFDDVIPKLYDAGFKGAFSVELFNKEYWAAMDAQTLLAKSYESTLQVLEKAMKNHL
ncbi:MAG: sugar phosphate isomerase/epimerase family protein [Aurantibacter sp.]